MPQGKDALSYDIVSYAVNAEDVVLLRTFRDEGPGFFVDVGAGDPVEGSVTKNLVDILGWRGLNIEPLPEFASALRLSRPRDVTLCVGIAKEAGVGRLYKVLPDRGLVGHGGLSTLDPVIAEQHRRSGWRIEAVDVQTLTLNTVLERHAVPGFDLLKVDVEGAEKDVLESVDLARWRPRVIVVEATMPDSPEPCFETWEPSVLAAGYSLALFDGLNRFYAREDEGHLKERLAVPANVFDRWIPVAWARELGVRVRRD
jgi:FkbM family methyltransferase